LTGRTLYVVQNQQNRVAVIALAANLASGRVVTRLSDRNFDVPTTIDDLGRRLYGVNARFGTVNPGSAAYQVVQLAKPKGVESRLQCVATYGGDLVSTWSVLRQSCKPRSPVGLVNPPAHKASAKNELALAA
jgi:hypothetical protein